MLIRKISIRGEKQTFQELKSSPEELIVLESSFNLNDSFRGAAEVHEVTLDENKLLEIVFEDDTRWFCDADTMDEVYPEVVQQNRSTSGHFIVPNMLVGSETERGLGTVFVKVINVFSKKPIHTKVKELAEQFEKTQLEGYSGVYKLTDSFQLMPFNPLPIDTPYLLFVHGTASSTSGSFGELKGSSQLEQMYRKYGDNVLAFQHETLTKSPLQNVLELIKQLPQNATLHIVSHSRGGIVGEILSRFGNTDDHNRGFDENEIRLLQAEGRDDDVAIISSISKELQKRKIIVEKFVRVACPAGGTTLASNRLNTYLNVIFNLIGYGTGIGATPAYIALKNLITAVLESKDKTDVLPGLEAQKPSSPFMKVLNNPSSKVVLDTQLSVVSGNCKVKANLKALLIILSKVFYLRDNDLVVDTHSMYMGSKRAAPVQYFFDNSTDTDHFLYFKNLRTKEALLAALEAPRDVLPDGYSTMREVLFADMDRGALLGLEGGQVFTDTVTGTKPIVMLLPGIMGSTLTVSEQLVWINYIRFIGGELSKLDINTADVEAPSLIGTSYKKLVQYLSSTYDVVTYPFDWRKQLYELADQFNDKINELLEYKQPIKIIGHSMGGVLVRDFMVKHPETWEKLNRSYGFRMIFLGSPLGGSFRIPNVLFGQDGIIQKLSKIDIRNNTRELLKIFSRLPGLLSLLPHTTDDLSDFASSATWEKMRDAFADENWPLPQPNDLAAFKEYRDTILKGLSELDYSNCIYIAGKDRVTPSGYRIDITSKGKELVFLSTAEGDQSVTWESGIPQSMIYTGSVYYVNVTHGSLANEPSIFKGISELLATGFTNLLSSKRPSTRSQEREFRTPLMLDFDLTPQGVENTLLGLTPQEEITLITEEPVTISVSHGDLHYAAFPVMAGHFQGDGILYAEKSIDKYLKGALSVRQQFGLYPSEVGTNEVVLSVSDDFHGALIVGLGHSGTLTSFQLTRTVEQGILNYALTLSNKRLPENRFKTKSSVDGISALIIGSGYGGLSVENSVRAVIQGVQNANRKIRNLGTEGVRPIQHIEFVEQMEHLALSCFYSVYRLAQEENNPFNIGPKRKIKHLLGAKRAVLEDATTGWWNRITVELLNEGSSQGIRCLRFTASTGGARQDQQELYSSTEILENLIKDISESNQWTPVLAKTIFELLIPHDFKGQLKKQGHINWILDKYTASFPWELLQDVVEESKPLSISAGMIRQLSTPDYRQVVTPVVQDTALVVADPNLHGYVNQLDGARREGELVNHQLSSRGFKVSSCINGSASEIIPLLFSNDYKIIHLAGHGFFDSNAPEKSGMVIGKGVYLSTREIKQMSTVPELVFVNCCYLGKADGQAEEYYQQRYRLAANIGIQLIENGVKAVVVAGWAVNDEAALDFTKVFYEKMFGGYPFGEAILSARQFVYIKYKNSNNTWGAYQCYGDQFYKLSEREQASNKYQVDFVLSEQAEVELSNLFNELDTGSYAKEEVLSRLATISKAVDRAGLRSGKITEMEAFIYAELVEYDSAIAKFESLMNLEKANFSIASIEKYCNIRAKRCVKEYLSTNKNPKEAIAEINKVIKDLKALLTISPTSERYSLIGSTYKRKGLVASKTDEKVKAYVEAASYYMKAYNMPDGVYKVYHLTNWLEMHSILSLAGKRSWVDTIKLDGEEYAPISMNEANRLLLEIDSNLDGHDDRMDYWDLVSKANAKLCQLFIHSNLHSNQEMLNNVLSAYQKVWVKGGSIGKKQAEIEHIEILSDALSIAETTQTQAIRDSLKKLKSELERS